MEILLANNNVFPKPVAVRGQAAGLVSKPPDISSEHSPGGDAGSVSPGCRTAFALGIEVSAPQYWQTLAVPGEPGQHRNCPQLSLTAGRETLICILSEVKGKFHQC